MGALNPGGWTSLDDGEGGDAPGLGWDEANPTANNLSEYYLDADGEIFAAGGMEHLGAAFDTSVFGVDVDGDLTFEYGGPSGLLIQGPVVYVTSPDLPGDYNGDGTVNAADYTVYRNRLAGIGGTTLVNRGPGITGPIGAADYAFWKQHYGDQAGSGATLDTTIPEPNSLALATAAVCALTTFARRRPTAL
jgi:hypothetical protein